MTEDDGSSRGKRAYDLLKKQIGTDAMPPGSRVREGEIAERFGISRTPVREALRRLEADGLIAHVAHQGAVVSELDRQAIIELYDMREVLEGTAARYAARLASEVDVLDLRELIDGEAGSQGDPVRLAQVNQTFHAALYRAAHNRYLLKALQSLSDAMMLLGPTTLASEGRADGAHREHMAIVDAISARDPDAAEAAAREHIRQAQRARLRMLRSAPSS